ncbi:MAG TPA: TetR/AcrR family transcriptional regulator [Chloroflexi bacterium]|nr:TetR/AcrR family transcriptional regulator [Chloroflexota bacterium]
MAVDRKEQIYETATQLFAWRGYNGASVRDIARQLDLQGGSLYSHITTKEELLWTILERAADQFLGVIEPIAWSDLSPAEKLRAAVHAHVGVVASNLEAATVYFHEWKFLTRPRREQFLARRRLYEHAMRAIVSEGVAAGVFRPQIDPTFATLAVLSIVNWLSTWYDPDGPLSPAEIADTFLSLLLNGLLVPEALSEEVPS